MSCQSILLSLYIMQFHTYRTQKCRRALRVYSTKSWWSMHRISMTRRPAISFTDRINAGASLDTMGIRSEEGEGRKEKNRYFNAQLWYDNASVHGIMYIGSCMIIWRNKAALSGHKLNRFSLSLFSVPLFSYRSPPTLSHSDHRKKRPPRRGTHLPTCRIYLAWYTSRPYGHLRVSLSFSSYVYARTHACKHVE